MYGNSYTDTGLTGGSVYYYKVTAYNSAGESAQSNYVTAVIKSNPSFSERLSGYWEKFKEGAQMVLGFIVIIVVILIIVRACSGGDAAKQSTQAVTTTTTPAPSNPKADYAEGTRLDADGNGNADFVVKNGRLIGTVSGKDFGPATTANFNSRKITK